MHKLFPFPHYVGENRYAGSIYAWPDKCESCRTQECRKDASDEIKTCPRGFQYRCLETNAVMFGLVVTDIAANSVAQKAARRRYPELASKLSHVQAAARAWSNMVAARATEISEKASAMLDVYIKEEAWRADYLQKFQQEIRKGLSFVHDYKQINQQLAQHVNVLLEMRYPGLSIEDKLRSCTKEERSIYEASKYLEEKLAVAKFLLHPEKLEIKSLCSSFRYHGLVHKYVMIYSSRFRAKNINPSNAGESYQQIYGNSDAVSVIPHTFIDNAAKYSPRGGPVEIVTQDENQSIRFEVSSFGPKIDDDEKQKIFHPFYRGRNAERAEEEGAGYGLYIAQLVAKVHLGCEIEVRQDARASGDRGHWTTFSVHLPLTALVAAAK